MSNWYIARATNMSFENVSLNLLDHNHWNDQQNHSAIPSALADWGFLVPVNNGVYQDTAIGQVVMSAKWHWREVVLHVLTKRGSCDANAPVRPMVVMARALMKLFKVNPQSAFLTGRSFTRLASVSSYAQITDQFCAHLNDPDGPGEPAILTYQDIWLNALNDSGVLEKTNGKFYLCNTPLVVDFWELLDEHGESMSACPNKDAAPQDYYDYMGDAAKGLPEILCKASAELLVGMFPNYARGTVSWQSLAPQQNINNVADFVREAVVSISSAGLQYESPLVARFVSALTSKPFVVLTGLSGSGKTKLAQSFTKWMAFHLLKRENCFFPGLKVSRANTDLLIKSVDTLGMVVAQGNGTLTSLSHELVDQWIETIVGHGYTLATPTATIRDKVINEHPQYSVYMHRFDSTLKPLAFYKLEHACAVEDMLTELLVPVGADWTNSEKLLGYPDALQPEKYVMPDTGVLKLLLDAEKNPKLPFFLILDEMNLSHVERYFADFLSAMESGDEIKLYDGDQRYGDREKTIAIPRKFRVPKNLFVIGTMNVDETTYMFSPKVLDRAQVIEFRVKETEMAKFVGHWENANHEICKPTDSGATWVDSKATKVDLSQLADANGIGKGAKYAESFLNLALARNETKPSDQTIPAGQPDAGKIPLREVANALNAFFKPLADLGAEFGYRSASEILAFCGYYLDAGATIDAAIDAAVVQKLLPKLHGSRRKLDQVLPVLWNLCLSANVTDELDAVAKAKAQYDFTAQTKYPLSAEKVLRMYRAAIANGFASFAEA